MVFTWPLLWTKVKGWFLSKNKIFQADVGATPHTHTQPLPSMKNLGWNKKSSQDWGCNRWQVYPMSMTCFQGQYIGWKIGYQKNAHGLEKFPYRQKFGKEGRYILLPHWIDLEFSSLTTYWVIGGQNTDIKPVSSSKH